MKFIYKGDHNSVEMFGYTFPQGQPIDVDESAIAYKRWKRTGPNQKVEIKVKTVDKLLSHLEFEKAHGNQGRSKKQSPAQA